VTLIAPAICLTGRHSACFWICLLTYLLTSRSPVPAVYVGYLAYNRDSAHMQYSFGLSEFCTWLDLTWVDGGRVPSSRCVRSSSQVSSASATSRQIWCCIPSCVVVASPSCTARMMSTTSSRNPGGTVETLAIEFSVVYILPSMMLIGGWRH